ncbi:MAG: hypothetical protein A2Y17_11130 [Clostridiales bacterium GWF2_38_85]|nr:MAG: hypothetical protein A2Y17_11130 [Clostridiales bacterium GWF2_38_85]HBL84678.1 hypothetical protein [Clostridiales bacterium]
MILEFEYTAEVGEGSSPQVVHLMDNSFNIIYLDSTGTVKGTTTSPEMGLYDSLTWKSKGRMSPDISISYPSLKKVAHYGAYGFWSSNGNHKFVMYMLPTDISHTIENGSITHSKDSAVSSASFTIQNINNTLLRRSRSVISPNTKLELYFSMGDSEEISLGQFYIDRVSTAIPGNALSVSARNAIGKLLKEQTFDENISFTEATLQENLQAIFTLAGIENFFVGDSPKVWKLTFEPETTYLSGVEDVVALLPGWKVSENSDGTIGIGAVTDTRFEQPGTFQFERNKNCWSYTTEYSDEQTYSRICVSCKNPSNTLYVDLPPHKLWVSPSHKTIYITAPDGTSAAELTEYANNLADSIAISGRTETFAGKFTPQMIIGDSIEMTADGETETIGIVTSIRHTLGRKGFYTEFTVDSSGRKGKPMLKDYVSQISGSKASSKVVIS